MVTLPRVNCLAFTVLVVSAAKRLACSTLDKWMVRPLSISVKAAVSVSVMLVEPRDDERIGIRAAVVDEAAL